MNKDIALTGHRPDKLGGYHQDAMDWLVAVAYMSFRQLQPKSVTSGFALGWDMAGAMAAIGLNIPLIAAIPFRGQERLWPESSRKLYAQLLEKASKVVYVCEDGYAPWKMQVRNQYMVDTTEEVLSMWDGTTGGTHNCVKYAARKEKPIWNAHPIYTRQSDILELIEYDGHHQSLEEMANGRK